MRTAHNHSPLQVFYEGVFTHYSMTGAQSILAGIVPDATYGIDEEAPASVEDGSDSVVVAPPSVAISPELYEELESTIDPTQDDNQHGITLYIATRDFLHDHGIE